MSGHAILVSHGQPSDPDVAEVELAALRAQVTPHLTGWTLASATIAKPGAIEVAVAAGPERPLVYPVFMTDGWFTQTALPKRFAGADARFLRPLGTDPALVDLAVGWLAETLGTNGWSAHETRLIVAAHGSGRSRNPSRDTVAFADAVQARQSFADLRIGFVEEPPHLAEVLSGAGQKAICLPFFATRRGHVLDDLPEAIEESGFSGVMLDPIGLHPDVPAVIAASLVAAPR